MSKVYKALQHARADQLRIQENQPKSQPAVHPTALPQPTRQPALKSFPLQLEQEMLELDQNLSHLRGHTKTSVTLFLGCQAGEGTSTIVRELAKVSSAINRKTILLIDAHPDLTQFTYFGVPPTDSLEEVVMNNQDFQDAVSQIGDSQVYLASLYSRIRSSAYRENPYKEEKIFSIARNRFDSILIDSPTIHSSLIGLELCKHVEGVVLVIEAERTKLAVIENIQSRISQSGGKLLGIIFNKQRHYIPEWIYPWV